MVFQGINIWNFSRVYLELRLAKLVETTSLTIGVIRDICIDGGACKPAGGTQWEDLSLLPDKASPRKSGSSNHIMHVSRYITNEMEVMLDQF